MNFWKQRIDIVNPCQRRLVITWNTVITTAAKNVTINKRSIIMMKKTGTLTEW